MKPIKQTSIGEILLLIAGIILAIYVRLQQFSIVSMDANNFLLPWYRYIATHGFWNAFANNFYNYNPPYLYLIGIATFFKSIPALTAIKLISVLFDISAGFAVYRIVAHYYSNKSYARLAFLTVLLLPTVFVESGHWGQCDVIYTSFLLWSVAALVEEKYTKGLILFSIAFVFKAQAIFLAPLFLILLIKKKFPWYTLVWPPIIYFLSILPAWLAGRPITDLLTIYFSQANTYPSLSMNAPSLFYPLGKMGLYSELMVWIGLGITVCFVGLYLIYRLRKPFRQETLFYLYDACYLTFLVPFFMPKMHDRYFFAATLFFVVMIFLDRKTIWLAVLVEVSSLLSYINWLYALPINLTEIAFWINIVVVVWLILWYGKKLTSPALVPNTLEPQPNMRN
jgi:Gpi18-like mannosyltransferase